MNQEFRLAPDVYPASWCGQVAGTAVDTIVEHYMVDASDNVRFSRVFTATATGKAIVSSASTTEKSEGPIDNGDGTISFVTAINGPALKFQALNGPVLKAADGQPLRKNLLEEFAFWTALWTEFPLCDELDPSRQERSQP